jgi:hypothetical protein
MRSNTKSHDDLSAVSALDAAEARARAALHLANEEAKRADTEERKSIILSSELATMKAVPSPIPIVPATTPDGKPLSISPTGVTVRGKHWKFTIPLTLILSLFPLIFTLASDYMQMKRDFKAQTETFARITARVEEVNTYAHDVDKSNTELRETVAQLSGYLAGVLPKAGVKVPGAEPGATYINVVSDPLPIGEMKKRQKPITVRTPVPAPAPK